jgi:hypothetical protein
MAVVSDLEKLQSTFFDENLKGGRASVNGVFYELLESMNRCDNNLASSNLIHDVWIKSLRRVRILNFWGGM